MRRFRCAGGKFTFLSMLKNIPSIFSSHVFVPVIIGLFDRKINPATLISLSLFILHVNPWEKRGQKGALISDGTKPIGSHATLVRGAKQKEWRTKGGKKEWREERGQWIIFSHQLGVPSLASSVPDKNRQVPVKRDTYEASLKRRIPARICLLRWRDAQQTMKNR